MWYYIVRQIIVILCANNYKRNALIFSIRVSSMVTEGATISYSAACTCRVHGRVYNWFILFSKNLSKPFYIFVKVYTEFWGRCFVSQLNRDFLASNLFYKQSSCHKIEIKTAIHREILIFSQISFSWKWYLAFSCPDPAGLNDTYQFYCRL